MLGLTLFAATAYSLGVPSGLASPASGCTPGVGWGTPRPDLANAAIAAVNAHRSARGLRPLAVSPSLTAAAVWKARHMAEYGYMAHDDPAPPVSRSTGARIAACGYGGGGWGENIAYGFPSAGSVVQAWLGSPGHRANIERAGYVVTGVGAAVRSNGAVYWAQTFGTSGGGAAPPTTRPSAAQSSRPTRQRPAVRRPTPLTTSQLFDLHRRPRAGRRYTVRVAVVRKANREWVRSGRVRCHAYVGRRKAWVGVHRFRRGLATCVFRTPRWAHGRRLVGSIRITAGGRSTARWFSRRIR